MSDLPELPAAAFAKQDGGDDLDFYAPPRLVTHIDEGAVAALTDCYRRLLPPGGAVLDLMSSWVSHLPDDVGYGKVVGHGMNADELAANEAATERIVHDLNLDPRIPLPDDDVDGVVCCVSVDYLVRPIEVLAEVSRVLRPGGTVAITFSNRCFPTKAVHGWLATTDQQHGTVVAELLRRAGGFTEPIIELRTAPGEGDPLYAVTATRVAG